MRTKSVTVSFLLIGSLSFLISAMPPREGRRPPGGERFLPPGAWWREPDVADALKLTGEQVEKLDALQKSEGDDAARIERDLMVVTRDLLTALDEKIAVAADIIAAGERLGTLRQELFRREISLLAKQRTILTQAQWKTLQDELERDRRPRFDDRRLRRPGGMGRRR